MSRTNKPLVIALATLPPPVTGLTVATERFIAATSNSIDWQIKSVGRPSATRRSGQLTRLYRSLKAGTECMLSSRSKVKSCYMPVSAGVTMVYNIVFAMVCAFRQIPLLVHHHSYSYLNNRSRMMALLNRFLTEKDGHVFLSETMRAAYDQQYKRKAQAVVLPNSFALSSSIESECSDLPKNENLKIGHLSNLSIEKGLKTVLEAFVELRLHNENCELHLAGPVTGPEEQKLLVEAQNRLGASLKIHGPLYGEGKKAFFTSIDYFWFPSQYVNEAQPIVLVEALAYGIPSIAIKRGCIEWLLGDAGIAASSDQQFVAIAVEQALRTTTDTDRLLARNRCKERFAKLREYEAIGFENAICFLSEKIK